MLSPNARFQRMAFVAIVAMLVLLPLAAMAAPPDTARPKSFAAPLDEEGKPIPQRAPVHNVAPTDQQRELATLKAEVQRLRAQNEMCSNNLDKAVAQLK